MKGLMCTRQREAGKSAKKTLLVVRSGGRLYLYLLIWRHSQYLVSAVAVAFWNSSYRSATDKVRAVPPRPRPGSP